MDQSSLVVIKDDVGLETLLKMYETKRRICSEEIALDTMIRSACELDSGWKSVSMDEGIKWTEGLFNRLQLRGWSDVDVVTFMQDLSHWLMEENSGCLPRFDLVLQKVMAARSDATSEPQLVAVPSGNTAMDSKTSSTKAGDVKEEPDVAQVKQEGSESGTGTLELPSAEIAAVQMVLCRCSDCLFIHYIGKCSICGLVLDLDSTTQHNVVCDGCSSDLRVVFS